MATSVPPQCQKLAQNLATAQETVKDLQEELNSTTNQEDKSRLFYLLRGAVEAASQANAALQKCLHPPPPLPNLTPTNFTIRRQPNGSTFDFAVLILNNGLGNAKGPFTITLGVAYLSIYAELNLNVPASTTIVAGATYTSDYSTGVPIVRAQGTTITPYQFYALVDPNNQVNETNEGDNQISKTILI